jgi:hypothetical protein
MRQQILRWIFRRTASGRRVVWLVEERIQHVVATTVRSIFAQPEIAYAHALTWSSRRRIYVVGIDSTARRSSPSSPPSSPREVSAIAAAA